MSFLQLVLLLDKTIEGINSILPIVSYRNRGKEIFTHVNRSVYRGSASGGLEDMHRGDGGSAWRGWRICMEGMEGLHGGGGGSASRCGGRVCIQGVEGLHPGVEGLHPGVKGLHPGMEGLHPGDGGGPASRESDSWALHWGGVGQTSPSDIIWYCQPVGGMHPIGMHSSFVFVLKKILKDISPFHETI